MKVGLIIVDHGSRSSESNALLNDIVGRFAKRFGPGFGLVEPAHMELAEPTIAQAYARCVDRGATHVIVCPLFLGPGKHWQEDIPRLAAEAALGFPTTQHQVAAPLGVDDLLLDLLAKRGFQSLMSLPLAELEHCQS
jgi:sirohydrochlorin ferrochelatase